MFSLLYWSHILFANFLWYSKIDDTSSEIKAKDILTEILRKKYSSFTVKRESRWKKRKYLKKMESIQHEDEFKAENALKNLHETHKGIINHHYF